MKSRHKPVAVIDIGSNSIRLVVYDGNARTPLPMFNEKAVCALGQGMGASGRLNPDGVPMARQAVGRFVRLARAMECDQLDILATAAVRDAIDGQDFVRQLERELDVSITILSGGEEASRAALGVLCGIPDAAGLVADLGGGSCELVEVGAGRAGDSVTMPLGVLRLAEASGGKREAAASLIERHLAEIPWLDRGRGRALYACGGAWRAVARLCIAQANHPIRILDNYSLDCAEAERIIDLISRMSRKSLEKVPGISKKRLASLPMAALLLERILQAARPSRLVFSVYGMREGQFFKRLPPRLQAEDPLLSACRQMARSAGRFPEHGHEIMDWMTPLFPDEGAAERRIRFAACLIGDIFWNEHPDYRASQGFLRTLRLPFVGLGHQDRARLALIILTRYQGDESNHVVQDALAMLQGDGDLRRVRAVGHALRLAHTLTGGVPDLLRRTALVPSRDTLVLQVPADDRALHTEVGNRSLARLARALGCQHHAVQVV